MRHVGLNFLVMRLIEQNIRATTEIGIIIAETGNMVRKPRDAKPTDQGFQHHVTLPKPLIPRHNSTRYTPRVIKDSTPLASS